MANVLQISRLHFTDLWFGFLAPSPKLFFDSTFFCLCFFIAADYGTSVHLGIVDDSLIHAEVSFVPLRKFFHKGDRCEGVSFPTLFPFFFFNDLKANQLTYFTLALS